MLAEAAESLLRGEQLCQAFQREYQYLREQPEETQVHLLTVQRALRAIEGQVLEAQTAAILVADAE